MAFWFLVDLKRLDIERRAITKLQEEADWLIGCDWLLNCGLQIKAIIRVGNKDYNVTLEYPNHFPFSPPIVRPNDQEERWSSHQYSSGTLCLEWGPDNWDTTLTAADMLNSTYRLISTERPDIEEPTVTAPSRHSLTVGQQLRSKYSRFCTTRSLRRYFGSLPIGSHGEVKFSLQLHRNCSTIVTREVLSHNNDLWCDPEVPSGLNASGLVSFFCKLPCSHILLKDIRTRTELYETCAKYGCPIQPSIVGTTEKSPPSLVLIIDECDAISAYWVPAGNDDRVFPEIIVDFADTISNLRLQIDSELLEGIKIGIIGVGSVGSKVAVSLARNGFLNFVLVDPDILCAENLVRHQLDWKSVGDHKADATASAIEMVMPGTHIKISKLHLTGQESNAALNGILSSLSNCSILLDATGDDSVFNLIAGVSTLENIPMVWGQVFEGGFGGLVARSRPGKDLTPHELRLLFLEFCNQTPFPQHECSAQYSGVVDGEVMMATDADVSSIASQLTSFIIDTVLNVEPSRYPNSLYLIGLSRGWVFEAPFHTIPISTTENSDTTSSNDTTEDMSKDGVKFISELLQNG